MDNFIAIPTGKRYRVTALFCFCDLRIKRKATESMTLWPFLFLRDGGLTTHWSFPLGPSGETHSHTDKAHFKKRKV